MRIRFVAGFGPIVRDLAESRRFYEDVLGLPLEDENYPRTDRLPGVKHFGLWSLEGAAESCFGTTTWPADLPIPQAGIEFDVGDAEEVAAAADELTGRGYRLLVGAKTEPWGQTVARLLGPEGLLVSVTFTPWLHDAAGAGPPVGEGP